ncbi:response regulator [Paenibacillus glycinis]|uniref:Response regulator n=1 Tax=Paenibacillus glycinis TaxID=2697035 RepID=A0ABW9XLD9_9BACL|nr:response regulator [Paenibacillus glycinis]NBD23443.1 response regulator [Paenibacillus glycinis]
MIYVLIVLLVCIGAFFYGRRRQRENGRPVLVKHETIQPMRIKPWEEQAEDDAGDGQSFGACPGTVLIVDDQPLIRMMLRELLEQDGVTVFEAPDGASAIEAVRKHCVDYVLLDLKLPDMSGIEALKGMRRINDSVSAALMTGFGSPEQLAEAELLGVKTYFMKPFDLQNVKKHVMNSLKKVKYKEGEVS